jgi:ribosomal protein S12 methylthiotransferase accessory factor
MRTAAASRQIVLGNGTIVVSDEGVILQAPTGTFVLDGREIATLAGQVLEAVALAGSRDGACRLLNPSLRPMGETFLNLLTRLSFVVEPSATWETSDLTPWQAAFARLVGDEPRDVARRLSEARIVFVGLEPWVASAAQHLVRAGVRAVHLADDGASSIEGSPLARTLHEIAPSCTVTHGPLAWTSDDDLELPSETWSLLIDAQPSAAVSRHKRLASFAHRHRQTIMFGAVEGVEIVVGPLTVPHRTACWECYRRRRLSSWDRPWVVPVLHQLAADGEPSRAPKDAGVDHACPASTLDTLGQLVSEEVLKVILFPNADTISSRILIHNFISRESSSHLILPAPYCDVCGGARTVTDPGFTIPAKLFDAESAEDLLRRAQGVVDSRTGIIAAVALRRRRADEPILPVCGQASVAGHSDGLAHAGRNDEVGGKGLTPAEAMLGAVGEALERYSASIVDEAMIVRAARAALPGDVLDPSRMHLYGDHQYDRPAFPYRRYSPDREYPWVRGSWLDGGGSVWVPALLAYFVTGSGDGHFCQVTSNGLACGSDATDAGLRASLELIERDALMASWMHRRPGVPIRRDEHLGLETRHIIESIERLGAAVELYLLPGRVDVPVVLCLGLGDGRRWPGVSVTAAAHWDPQAAAYRAVAEHGYSCAHIRRTIIDNPEAIPKTAADVHTFLDHALYYAPLDRRSACEFWRSSDGPAVSIAQIKSWDHLDFADKARALTTQQFRIAIVDVTSPDLKLTDIRVVRALCEDAYPLSCGAGLQRWPRGSAAALNQDPHPMA